MNISFTQSKRQDIEQKLGYSMPEEDYMSFVECYEGVKHLEEIRAALKSGVIIEMKTFATIPRTSKFPKSLSLPDEKQKFLKDLYQIICSLDAFENITYARKIVIGKRRSNILKLLRMFGLCGKLLKNGVSNLLVDSQTFSDQKIISYHNILLEYFSILENHGMTCKIVPEVEEGWETPGGGLRKKGWKTTLSLKLDEKQNLAMLKLLQEYSGLLHNKHGDKAFRYFSRADLGVFSAKL